MVINVFFLRSIAKDFSLDEKEYEYYDIITPYGYGGIDCLKENIELLQYYHKMF